MSPKLKLPFMFRQAEYNFGRIPSVRRECGVMQRARLLHFVESLVRNQGYRVLLSFVQGCRSLVVASTWSPSFRDTAALVSR
jgi:hypothetical protein